MTDLSSIAAEARRMAADYRRRVDDSTRDMLGPNIYLRQYCNMAAADFDRLAEMADDAMADTTFSRALAERLAEP